MKFSPAVALVLGVILAAAEAVQLNISMSVQAHDGLTLVVMVLSGVGVLVATPAAIVAFVPHDILVLITALLGALNVIQTSAFSLSTTWHTIIAVVIVIGAALFSTTGIPAHRSAGGPRAVS